MTVDTASDPKERILQAATELLIEKQVSAQITTRQIAERAGVGIGLINYHYQSKDALLMEAYNRVFLAETLHWLDDRQAPQVDPLLRLKMMVQHTAEIALKNLAMAQVSLSYDLIKGRMETPTMLLPLLRQITAGKTDELSLRLMALALVSTLQAVMLRKEAFESYLGIDLEDPQQRQQMLDTLIEKIVLPKKEE